MHSFEKLLRVLRLYNERNVTDLFILDGKKEDKTWEGEEKVRHSRYRQQESSKKGAAYY